MKTQNAFTLIELLIVIAIIAILGSATVLVLNPVEMLKQSRDSQRTTDLDSLYKVINLAKFNNPTIALGSSNTVYVSIPYDAATDCGYGTGNPFGLPGLPLGWSYKCATTANYKKADGSGWLPVNLSGVASSIPSLPSDPKNDKDNFYAYVADATDSTFVINSYFESQKQILLIATRDGGFESRKYEVGTKLALLSSSNTNIIPNGNLNAISSGYSPGWDTALNLTYRPTTGFSSGWNGGVSSPTTGYHAHIELNCGPDGSPCMSEIDQNTPYGYPHRWLGTNYQISDPATNYGWHTGTKIRMKFDFKATTTGKPAHFGLHHNEGSGYSFGSTMTDIYPRVANGWQEAILEAIIPSTWLIGPGYYVAPYLYGESGSEGTIWFDNIEVTYIN